MKLLYHMISTLALFAFLSFDLPLAQAQQSNSKDPRDIEVGMAVTELPVAGYTNFVCAGEGIADWLAWRVCPAEADGLYAIRLRSRDQQRGNDRRRPSGDSYVIRR